MTHPPKVKRFKNGYEFYNGQFYNGHTQIISGKTKNISPKSDSTMGPNESTNYFKFLENIQITCKHIANEKNYFVAKFSKPVKR